MAVSVYIATTLADWCFGHALQSRIVFTTGSSCYTYRQSEADAVLTLT